MYDYPFSIIKRIPRAARHKATVVFTSCLRDVNNNGSTANWEHLLNFATALRQPSMGGHRFTFTVQILAQLETFDSGDVIPTSTLISFS